MNTLHFDAKEVLVAAKHAIGGTGHSMGYMSKLKPGPALFLVHDSGVYLMSNAKRSDDEIAKHHGIAYADGCNPHIDKDDCWDNSRFLVGGDDFAETIPIDAGWLPALESNAEVQIRFGARSFKILFKKKRTTTK